MVINNGKLIQERDVKDISLDNVILNERNGDLRLAVKTHHVIADQFKAKLKD
jgi:hypothetical protein